MNVNLHIFNARGRLTPYIIDSENALKETEKRLPKNFPINNLDIDFIKVEIEAERQVAQGLASKFNKPIYVVKNDSSSETALRIVDITLDSLYHKEGGIRNEEVRFYSFPNKERS